MPNSNLVERLEAEATRRWASIPTHVRELLAEAAHRIEQLEVELGAPKEPAND